MKKRLASLGMLAIAASVATVAMSFVFAATASAQTSNPGAQAQPGALPPGAPQPGQLGPGRRFPRDGRPFPGRGPRPGGPGPTPPMVPDQASQPAAGADPHGTGPAAVSGEHVQGDAPVGVGGHGDQRESEHEKHHDFNFADFGNKDVAPYAALLINFGILITLYYLLGKKGVAEGLKKRKDSIAKEIEEAQRMLKEAEARAVTYQAKLKNLETELGNARKALEEAGKGERDRIVRDAEEKAERMKRDAAFLVDQELKQMRVDLTREAIEVAIRSAEELLRTKATAQDHERLAQDFLADLDKAPAASATSAGGAA